MPQETDNPTAMEWLDWGIQNMPAFLAAVSTVQASYNPQPQLPETYTWRFDVLTKGWHCPELDIIVTDIMLADPERSSVLDQIRRRHPDALRALVRARADAARKRVFPECQHEDKLNITSFGDPKEIFMCRECGWRTPTPRRKDEIELCTEFVAEAEKFIRSWKRKDKETTRVLVEAEKFLKEIL